MTIQRQSLNQELIFSKNITIWWKKSWEKTETWGKTAVIMSDKKRERWDRCLFQLLSISQAFNTLVSHIDIIETWSHMRKNGHYLSRAKSLLRHFTGNCVFKYWRWVQFKYESSEKYKNKICNKSMSRKLVASQGAMGKMF